MMRNEHRIVIHVHSECYIKVGFECIAMSTSYVPKDNTMRVIEDKDKLVMIIISASALSQPAHGGSFPIPFCLSRN